MPTYTFRSNVNTPQGALSLVDLDLRVLASLNDAEAAGIAARYDWATADVGIDEVGDYVRLDIEWPDGLSQGEARQYIDRHFVTVE